MFVIDLLDDESGIELLIVTLIMMCVLIGVFFVRHEKLIAAAFITLITLFLTIYQEEIKNNLLEGSANDGAIEEFAGEDELALYTAPRVLKYTA